MRASVYLEVVGAVGLQQRGLELESVRGQGDGLAHVQVAQGPRVPMLDQVLVDGPVGLARGVPPEQGSDVLGLTAALVAYKHARVVRLSRPRGRAVQARAHGGRRAPEGEGAHRDVQLGVGRWLAGLARLQAAAAHRPVRRLLLCVDAKHAVSRIQCWCGVASPAP